jgi:hypothetical protein
MCAAWISRGFDLTTLVKRLDSVMERKPNGEVSTSSLEFDDYRTVLLSALDFDKDFPEIERTRLLWKALWAAARAGPMTNASILSEINRRESEFLATPRRRFVLATQLSLRSAPKRLRALRHGDATLALSRSLPPRFLKARRLMETEGQVSYPLRDKKPPTDFNYLRVRVSAWGRSDHEGGSRAIHALDLLRSIWNFIFNERVLSSSSSSPRAVNRILLGPLHTLHLPNGDLATREFWWWEPGYERPVDGFDLAREWPRIEKVESLIRERIRNSPYRGALEDSFVKYGRALDGTDYDQVIVALWSLMERLTATTKHAEVVGRAASLWPTAEWHREVLNHVRLYRNRAVHAGEGGDIKEDVLYQVKRHAERLLLFHVRSGRRYASIEDAAEFLSLPTDPAELRRRRRLLDRAIKFHKA